MQSSPEPDKSGLKVSKYIIRVVCPWCGKGCSSPAALPCSLRTRQEPVQYPQSALPLDQCGDRDRTLFQESTGVLESGSWDMGREWGYERAHF